MKKEEKQFIKSYEKDEWVSVNKAPKLFKKYVSYARASLKKDKRINIRISSRDLEGIQKKAIEEGLPYQTFISSIIHRYITGRLKKAS
jgi:predicted DNA binding CopG/RHH family protein